MSEPEDASLQTAQAQLEAKLREVDEQFRKEMRARGFDPGQSENLALPGPLARMYMERENLREELETLADSEHSKTDGGRS